jgi:uncharacterized protein
MKKSPVSPLKFLIGALLLAAALPSSAQNEPGRAPDRRTLTVTGTGEASAAPDRALVRLGAIAQAPEAAAAQTSVNEVMQKALGLIQKVGIDRRAIRTSGLTLTPIYSPNSVSTKTERPAEPRIVAYRAGNVIEVTIDDLKQIGRVIDAGLESGANRLEGVTFELRDDQNARAEALRNAVREARAKARTIGEALDVQLGGVREVNEGGVQIFRPNQFAGARMMAADAMQTPVEPGAIRIQATVTVHYDLLTK